MDMTQATNSQIYWDPSPSPFLMVLARLSLSHFFICLFSVSCSTILSHPWPSSGLHFMTCISKMFLRLPFSWYRLSSPLPIEALGELQPFTLPSPVHPLFPTGCHPHLLRRLVRAPFPRAELLILHCLQDLYWPHEGEIRTRPVACHLDTLFWLHYQFVLPQW